MDQAVEQTARTIPLEREQNESLADYVARLYEKTMRDANSISEAMQKDPTSFARMINHIPDMVRELRATVSGDQGELPK